MSAEDTAALQSKDEEIARLSTQVADLLAQASVSEFETKLAEATAAGETKIAELQASLDLQVLETEKAKSDLAELVSAIETAEADQVAATEQATRWSGRLELIKEHASLMPDARIEERKAHWSAMSDEEFAALVEDFKVASATDGAPAPVVPGSATPATAMVAAAGSVARRNPVAEVMNLRFKGVDVRKVS